MWGEAAMPLSRMATVLFLAMISCSCNEAGGGWPDADSDAAEDIDASEDTVGEDPAGEPGGDGSPDPAGDPLVDLPVDLDYPDGMPGIGAGTYAWTGCPDPLPPGSSTDPMVDAVFVVEDMEMGYPVEGVQLEVFFSNTASGAPDLDASNLDPTDVDGEVPASVPASRAIAVRVVGGSTPLYPPGVVQTSVAFDVETPAADDGLIRVESVSRATYQLITTVLGITPDPTQGILFGTLADCLGAPVEGAVARLYEPSGSRCHGFGTCLDRYFIDDTPAADQWWTSDDGMFAVLQVPPSAGYGLELHGIVLGSGCPADLAVLAGRGSVEMMADTISIVDLSCTDVDDSPWSVRCVL
jgi:hypothetical protein